MKQRYRLTYFIHRTFSFK